MKMVVSCPGCGKPMHYLAKTCRDCYLRDVAASEPTCPKCGGPRAHTAKVCRNCWAPKNGRNDDNPFPMSGSEKAAYGCIVSFENAEGKTFSVVRKGGVTKGIREACEIAVALDETFRVVCISSPQSIYTDLQGIRFTGSPSTVYQAPGVRCPEAQQLARAGVRDMLHPRLAQ